MMAKKEIGCAINPACGNEAFEELKATDKPLNVAIVGGGPAGMEAARIAAVRGHKVTLFEKTGELGGAILGCCMTPGKEKMKWYADWIRVQLKKLPVEIRLNTTPGVDDLKGFDAVLNATGASSYVPECIGKDKVLGFESVIACPKVNCEFHPGKRMPAKTGEKVLVWGDHYAATDTAAYLASIGKQVTIVTENKEFGSSVEVIHMYVLRKRFQQTDAEALESKPFKHPVKVIESSTVYSVANGEVVVQDKDFNRTTLSIDTVVSCHTRANDAFFAELLKAGIPAFNVGDAVRPRNLNAAVHDGAMFGLNLDADMLLNPNGAMMNNLPLDVLGLLRD
jgi:NADPH-dependent 2,4-dienoyl-CoA reductase/sulfur reductase-like enzyme